VFGTGPRKSQCQCRLAGAGGAEKGYGAIANADCAPVKPRHRGVIDAMQEHSRDEVSAGPIEITFD
jgi:hypothetical protein